MIVPLRNPVSESASTEMPVRWLISTRSLPCRQMLLAAPSIGVTIAVPSTPMRIPIDRIPDPNASNFFAARLSPRTSLLPGCTVDVGCAGFDVGTERSSLKSTLLRFGGRRTLVSGLEYPPSVNAAVTVGVRIEIRGLEATRAFQIAMDVGK